MLIHKKKVPTQTQAQNRAAADTFLCSFLHLPGKVSLQNSLDLLLSVSRCLYLGAPRGWILCVRVFVYQSNPVSASSLLKHSLTYKVKRHQLPPPILPMQFFLPLPSSRRIMLLSNVICSHCVTARFVSFGLSNYNP